MTTTRTRKEKAAQHHPDGQSPIEVKHLPMLQQQQQTAQLADTLLQGFENNPLELVKFLASQHPGPKRSMRLQSYRDPYEDHKRCDYHHRIALPEVAWQWIELNLIDALLLGDQHYTGGWMASDLLKIASELELVRNRYRISGGELEQPIGVLDSPEEMLRGIAVTLTVYLQLANSEGLLPLGGADHPCSPGRLLVKFLDQISCQLPGKPTYLLWSSR